MRVLIADDSLFVRSCLRKIFEDAGHEVVGEAENGHVAVELYSGTKPDVVTMDITMPEVNGLEAIKMIKGIDPTAKIIVVSAMGLDPVIKEAFTNGAKGFITKPFVPDKVIQELEAVTRFAEKTSK
ncbi:MAG: response regulator [Bacillota bacterium]